MKTAFGMQLNLNIPGITGYDVKKLGSGRARDE